MLYSCGSFPVEVFNEFLQEIMDSSFDFIEDINVFVQWVELIVVGLEFNEELVNISVQFVQ